MNDFSIDDVEVYCQDDYKLAATLFKLSGKVKGVILIGPATGISQRFYKGVAEF